MAMDILHWRAYGSGVPKRRTLPAEVSEALDALADALGAIANGAEPSTDPATVLDAAIAAAHEAQERDPYNLAIPLEDIPGDRLRQLRRESGWTQQALADAMNALGFGWVRQTVNQVEHEIGTDGSRRVRGLSFAELFALASLFGVPVLDFLLPRAGESVEVGAETQVGSRQARELILGRGGKTGQGGPQWVAAASLAPADVTRPAHELWKRRRAADKETK